MLYFLKKKLLFSFYMNIFTLNIFFFMMIFIFSTLMYMNSFNFSSNTFYYKKMKIFLMYLFLLNFFLILIKFIMQISFFKLWAKILIMSNFNLQVLHHIMFFFNVGFYTNNVGLGLLILCYLTTIISLMYLGDSELFLKGTSVQYFTFFLICTTMMVWSTNLLVIFMSFELIFLPSIYFVYALGYVKKVDKSIYYLLIWTLFGSFLVLGSFAYIYSMYHSLDFKVLVNYSLTFNNNVLLYLCFFIGFGIKLPIFPFHYWLTKVHVEAPAGFSMFLSGYLVKTALYCFYYINLLFTNSILTYYFMLWLCVCIVEASMKMWVQVDVKKLIAFATMQEMNMLLVYLLLVQKIFYNIFMMFLMMHGVLSSFMFFLVDQIQKRAQTRNIHLLSGFGLKYPMLQIAIWVMILFYLGLPLTVKFMVEWFMGGALICMLGYFGFFMFGLALVLGGLGFVKVWFIMMYGTPSKYVLNLKTVDLLKSDKIFIWFLISILIILSILLFIM